MHDPVPEGDDATDELDEASRAQLRDRLRWTPAQRLAHLREMVAFDQRAARARRVS
jgi:hypothetical protein